MPVPLHTSLQSIVRRLFHVIWIARMDVDERSMDDACQTHASRSSISIDQEECIWNPNKIADQYVIYVLHKQTHNLLEKWIFVLNDARSRSSSQDSHSELSDIATIVDELPATHLRQLYFISGCCSSYVKAKTNHGQDLEFATANGGQEIAASLAKKSFQLSDSVSITLEYDSNAFWSNQRLDFTEAEEREQQIYPSYEDQLVHPLSPKRSTTTTATSTSAVEHMQPTVLFRQAFETRSSASPPEPLSLTPTVAVRRLSRLSISALESEAAEEDGISRDISADHLNPLLSNAIPIPVTCSQAQYTHRHYMPGGRRTSITYSISPRQSHSSSHLARFQQLHDSTALSRRDSTCLELGQHRGSLVGSFEESLLSGRMSFMPLSKSIDFVCQIGVLGRGNCKPSLKCPPHWNIPFPATFYSQNNDKFEDSYTTAPYVGTVDIQHHIAHTLDNPSLTGYRIPPKGQLQFVVKNPNRNAVKLFLIPYDFSDMPINTKTFLRQTSYQVIDDNASQQQQEYDKGINAKKVLRYAIHMQFVRNERKRIYLYKSIRIVFMNRKLDMKEKLDVVCEGPKEPVYVPL